MRAVDATEKEMREGLVASKKEPRPTAQIRDEICSRRAFPEEDGQKRTL